MKRLVSSITVGNFTFDYVTELTVRSSWDTFTDTATIVLPNKFRDKDGQTLIVGTDNVFKRGDAVEIKVGYFPNLVSRFKGFISNIKPDSPLVLDCEDRMWQLKQVNLVSKEFRDTTIKDVVEYATASETGLTIEFDDKTAKIGHFKVDNKGFINAVTVFEVLKKQFGYNIYFVDEVLNVRILKSILSLGSVVEMGFQKNIIDDTLKFQRDDDVGMVVRFESKQTDNTVFTFFGSKVKGETVINETVKVGGIVHSWRIPELSKATIKKIITENIDKFVWKGFTGDFLTFLEPVVDHSDQIQFEDFQHTERDGKYLIKSTETRFGVNGGRQIVELRNKIA